MFLFFKINENILRHKDKIFLQFKYKLRVPRNVELASPLALPPTGRETALLSGHREYFPGANKKHESSSFYRWNDRLWETQGLVLGPTTRNGPQVLNFLIQNSAQGTSASYFSGNGL